MADDYREVFYRPVQKAHLLFWDYGRNFLDFKNYRCDAFLSHLLYINKIKLDFFPFSSEKFCGMLTIDDFETTIVVNKNSPTARRNFTIAHEIGHYYFHRKLNDTFPDRADDLLNSTNNLYEKQANAFAAEIVMPTTVLQVMLKSKFSFHRIALTSHISYETLRFRIIRHLKDIYKLGHNTCVQIVEDYENDSLLEKNHNSQIFQLVEDDLYDRLITKYQSQRTVFKNG